jgi:hypothetical protein
MDSLTKASLGLALLGLHIGTQSLSFPDKGILAIGYIGVTIISLHLGKNLKEYKEDILRAVFISSLISGFFALVYLTLLPYEVHGLAGFLGQKNLLANWIACGIIAGLYFWTPTNVSMTILCMMLFIIGALSGSKTFFLYIPLIVWIYKLKREENSNAIY